MARGSRFSAVLNFFRNADADEVRAIMPLVLEAAGRRKILIEGPRPMQKRHRRTKAELAAARAPEVATAAGA